MRAAIPSKRTCIPIGFRTVIATCLSLSGCAGLDEAIEVSDEYAGTPVVRYDNASGSWRISDKPNEGRLKIGPSLAGSFGAAFGRTVTFTALPKNENQETVEDWLTSTGRSCTITDGYLLVDPQWEFRYSCR
jgi:hypothetical protein